MSKKRKVLTGFGIFMVLLTILYIDTSVYPFTSQKPNFYDVERVFNRMQFPSNWQEIRSSENRGIAGRQCPIEPSTRCFHKSKTFKVPATTNEKDVVGALLLTGCPAVDVRDNTALGETEKTYSLSCSIDGLDISSSFRGPEDEVYVSTGT